MTAVEASRSLLKLVRTALLCSSCSPACVNATAGRPARGRRSASRSPLRERRVRRGSRLPPCQRREPRQAPARNHERRRSVLRLRQRRLDRRLSRRRRIARRSGRRAAGAAPAVPQPRQRHVRGRHRRAGIAHPEYGMGACAADYDNDGWIDLYVTNVGPNVLYHNNGGKTLHRRDATGRRRRRRCSARAAPSPTSTATATSICSSPTTWTHASTTTSSAATPASRSASTATRSTSRRLRSSSTATTATARFTDVSRAGRHRGHRGNGLGVVFGDYDDDGWPDIFVANDTTPNFLYHNERPRRFKSRARRRRVGRERRQAARRHGHRLRRLRRRRPPGSFRDEPRAGDAHAVPESRRAACSPT